MRGTRYNFVLPVLLLCMSNFGQYSEIAATFNGSSYYHQNNASNIHRQYNDIANASNTRFEVYRVPQSNATSIKYVDLNDEPSVARLMPAYETHLTQTSVIYGLTKVANATNVNAVCLLQMQHIQRGIQNKHPWAMKVLDASGIKPAGFVFGQNFWLGSREACGAVQKPVGITLSKNFDRVMNYAIITERAPFDIDYRVIYLRHNSPWQVEIKLMSEQIIHIGLCLPSACSSLEIQNLTADYVERGMFVENEIFDIHPEVIYMKDLKLKESFYERTTFKMFSSFVIFTLLMMTAASFLRVKSLIDAEAAKSPTDTTTATANATSATAATIATSALPNQQNEKNACGSNAADDSGNNYLQYSKDFIKCFDLQSNWQKVFATKTSTANEIPVINGLRSVCAIWIMIFHVVWFMYFTVNNKTFLISYAERVFFQYVSSAPLLVDVFFTVSGFLQTYNFLRNGKQMEVIRQNSLRQNTKQFFKLLFHRYLRLGPLYLVVIAVVDLLYSYIGDTSVYHINERFDEMCTQHWWRNLLFIQNLFDHKDMCVNWTWSLACEMQYFILATILLFTYAKHPKYVKTMVCCGLVGTVAWSYTIGFHTKFQLSFDSTFATGTQIYISPFVRILPYIIGAMAAWYLLEKHKQYELSDNVVKCLWNLAILTFFVCIYSTIKRDMSYFICISLFVFGRFAFSLSVCWMIIGSATGVGSWWSRILEAQVFQHVSRVSYAIYLLNPFVIAFFFGVTSVSTHADPFMLCVLCSGFAVIVYLASVIFSLAFEMPYCNWSSLLLKRSKLKSA